MSQELDVMVLATHGAQVLITEMLTGGWQLLREKIARFLRRDGQERSSRQLEMLDEIERSLPEASEADREAIQERLVRQFAAYLDRFPEMADELRELLPTQDEASSPASTMAAYNNTNSQILQSLGDIDAGDGGINYGVPSRKGER
ncbi:hypothetical protein [Streptomyces guryensis]|uniref:Uncharacterized protein n=1 Tax=Streptomyces guryensis TaxID=2886947 RepID=A0A9Q3VK44_9ACTN|nr:hypothetical protein [Streptomyces guryensis]MCD9872783.1 hypothetical protein [Streptomyces guryensis]